MRLGSRLTYANVIATLALCLAIGGGVTLAAVGGSGSVKFGAEKGLSSAAFETVLSLNGIGKVQAFCDNDVTIVRFKNTSGKRLQATSVRASDGSFFGEALDDGDALQHQAGNPQATFRFHVFTADANGKPAADITVGSKFATPCPNRVVTAQAVRSE